MAKRGNRKSPAGVFCHVHKTMQTRRYCRSCDKPMCRNCEAGSSEQHLCYTCASGGEKKAKVSGIWDAVPKQWALVAAAFAAGLLVMWLGVKFGASPPDKEADNAIQVETETIVEAPALEPPALLAQAKPAPLKPINRADWRRQDANCTFELRAQVFPKEWERPAAEPLAVVQAKPVKREKKPMSHGSSRADMDRACTPTLLALADLTGLSLEPPETTPFFQPEAVTCDQVQFLASFQPCADHSGLGPHEPIAGERDGVTVYICSQARTFPPSRNDLTPEKRNRRPLEVANKKQPPPQTTTVVKANRTKTKGAIEPAPSHPSPVVAEAGAAEGTPLERLVPPATPNELTADLDIDAPPPGDEPETPPVKAINKDKKANVEKVARADKDAAKPITPPMRDRSLLQQFYGKNRFTQYHLDHYPGSGKWISLTFDGDHMANCTDAIVKILREKNVPATMFLTGTFIKKYPEATELLWREGFEIGNHTWGHPHLTSYKDNQRHEILPEVTRENFRAELHRTADAYRELTGRNMAPFWRAPYGEHNQQIRTWAYVEGYLHIGWTRGFDSIDWLDNPQSRYYWPPEKLKTRLLTHLEQTEFGTILLFHLGSKRKDADQPYHMLASFIDEVRARGYEFITTGEAIRRHEGVQMGGQGGGKSDSANMGGMKSSFK